MNEIDIDRSVRFVSLDTHPANNALVVTYEILVIATDSQKGHELARQTKRDQLQINIAALDNLSEKDVEQRGNKTMLNLRELSEEIIRKCALLKHMDETQTLEDIQLHLLYLFNRKQSQIYQAATNADRPPSAASNRLRSATPAGTRSRLASARQGSARSRDGRRSSLSSRSEVSSSLDVYTSLCEKEMKDGLGRAPSSDAAPSALDEYLQQFQQHLMDAEAGLQIGKVQKIQDSDLETQLEGLYGELPEKLAAIASIRCFVSDDQKLASIQPNKLLINAMHRTLQDSALRDSFLSESILYCLVRFTQFEDIYERMFNQGDPIDIMRVIIDLLDEHVRLATKADDLRMILNHFHQINSPIVILNNLINLDSHAKSNQVKKKLIQQHGKRVANILIGLFVIIGRHLARDVRNQSAIKYERLTLVLAELLKLSQSLVIFREFVNMLRTKSQTLVESLINSLNTLQMCRPGSGSIQQTAQQGKRSVDEQQRFMVKDQIILCEIYELEIEALKLINNLIYDTRFRLRFARKNLLLKCVLRNLVVFLASSRQSNTLTPFDRSSVLLVPFKCLYELSCENSIREELFKSKIITKCLFEYLLSSTTDSKILLDSLATDSTRAPRPTVHEKQLIEDDQITVEPSHATHYILATWINLSARESAPFFGLQVDKELTEPLCDYIDLTLLNLDSFISRILQLNGQQDMTNVHRDAELVVYVHAKLLRNVSQYLRFFQSEPVNWAESFARWVERLSLALDRLLSLLKPSPSFQIVGPLAVECVATLANMMQKSDCFWPVGAEMSASPMLHWPPGLGSIVNRLLQFNLSVAATLDGDHDDLLLVSINLLGVLAKCCEICTELGGATRSIVDICNFTLESKGADAEMTVSCLFSMSQLVNHAAFLQALGGSLEDERQEAILLVDRLSSLIMHGDPGISKLANLILNTLKQHEERQSLSDSVTCKRRFACYNEKWLSAIRANRDEASANDDDMDQVLAASRASARAGRDPDMIDDFNQLRTVGAEQEEAPGSRMSTSSSNRSSNMYEEDATVDAGAPVKRLGHELADHANDHDLDHDRDGPPEEAEDEEEEEETFSEPDLNVIDANSMIKHLTNRREFRSELLMRR